MARLLEFRERIKEFCGKHETYVKIALRFVLALVAFFVINYNIGYFELLGSVPIMIGLAIVCALLPVNVTILVSAILVIANLYALSLEVFAVAVVMCVIMLFLYFRFAPKDACHALLTPILFTFGIPYVMPISAGLLRSPASIISVLCGVVTYYFLSGVKACEALLSESAEDNSVTSVFSVILNQIFNNRELFLVLIVFLVTTILVYVIRRKSIDHAWTVAIGVGTIFNLLVLLIGLVTLHAPTRIVGLIIGEAVSLGIAFVIHFMAFNLDYSRVEHVQFEDDEYYYYVKAVPKMYVTTENKRVKNFTENKSGHELESGTKGLFEDEDADIEEQLIEQLLKKKDEH